MNKYIDVEGSAKNINDALEKAVAAALAQLGRSREEITYELIDQKKGGLFGLGEKTAKVRVFTKKALPTKPKNSSKACLNA